MKKLSFGSWAYIFNQKEPTNDFHEVLHKLHHLRLRWRRTGQLRRSSDAGIPSHQGR